MFNPETQVDLYRSNGMGEITLIGSLQIKTAASIYNEDADAIATNLWYAQGHGDACYWLNLDLFVVPHGEKNLTTRAGA